MLFRRRFVVVPAVAIFFFGPPSVQGEPVEDRDWLEVRTENFRVRSDLREKDAIELIRYLELFRAAVLVITNVSSTESTIPTNIYVLSRGGDFTKLGVDRDFAGVFVPGQRSNMIIMRNVHGMKETSTILHEYVHFLMHNQSRLNYPGWFNEGFAEYLSATRLSKESFEVGLFPDQIRPALNFVRWIPIRKIISAENYAEWRDADRAMFYAESWSLVNYLQNRKGKESLFARDLGEYIARVETGKSDTEAFEETFGMSMNEINRKVRKHLERGRFTVFKMRADDLLPVFEPEIIRLTREQISLYLGQVALHLGELDAAKNWFEIAASHVGTRPQAEAGLGDVYKFSGDFGNAQSHFERAVALAPDDPYCQLDLAEYWHTRAEKTLNMEQRKEFVERARTHYVKAWKLDDSMPETYAQYGGTFLLEGQRYDKAIEMLEEAEYLLPSEITIRTGLAEAYAAAGRVEDAERMARSVLAWSHYDSDIIEWAQELMIETNSGDTDDTDAKVQQPMPVH